MNRSFLYFLACNYFMPGKKPPRWNQFSLGQAAILFSRGASPHGVASHFFKRYGGRWRDKKGKPMQSQADMFVYLFGSPPQWKPDLIALFNGKSRGEIQARYREWLTRHSSSRARISAAKKGKLLSFAHRAKLSLIRKGRPSPMRGKKLSAAGCANIAAGLTGRELSREHRARIAASVKASRRKSAGTEGRG